MSKEQTCITISSSEDDSSKEKKDVPPSKNIRSNVLKNIPPNMVNNVEKEVTSVSSKLLFGKFLDSCKALDDSHDMDRVIVKLWAKYNDACPSYTKSKEFHDLVMKKMNNLPKDHYTQLKVIADELKFHHKTKKHKEVHPKMSSVEPSTSHQVTEDIDPKTQQHIKLLTRKLKELQSYIRKLEVKEVFTDSSDDEDSNYIQLSRYKDRFCKVFKKLCELQNQPDHAGRKYLQRIQFSGTEYPVVNRAVEKFYNKTRKFPDFPDVLNLVKKVNVEEHLRLKPEQVYHTAKVAFDDLGPNLQKLRIYDYYDTFSSYFSDGEDPADNDPDLRKKLDENSILYARKEKEVIDMYVKKQVEHNLEPEPVDEETADRSTSEEEQEEEEEEGGANNEIDDLDYIVEDEDNDDEDDNNADDYDDCASHNEQTSTNMEVEKDVSDEINKISGKSNLEHEQLNETESADMIWECQECRVVIPDIAKCSRKSLEDKVSCYVNDKKILPNDNNIKCQSKCHLSMSENENEVVNDQIQLNIINGENLTPEILSNIEIVSEFSLANEPLADVEMEINENKKRSSSSSDENCSVKKFKHSDDGKRNSNIDSNQGNSSKAIGKDTLLCPTIVLQKLNPANIESISQKNLDKIEIESISQKNLDKIENNEPCEEKCIVKNKTEECFQNNSTDNLKPDNENTSELRIINTSTLSDEIVILSEILAPKQTNNNAYKTDKMQNNCVNETVNPVVPANDLKQLIRSIDIGSVLRSSNNMAMSKDNMQSTNRRISSQPMFSNPKTKFPIGQKNASNIQAQGASNYDNVRQHQMSQAKNSQISQAQKNELSVRISSIPPRPGMQNNNAKPLLRPPQYYKCVVPPVNGNVIGQAMLPRFPLRNRPSSPFQPMASSTPRRSNTTISSIGRQFPPNNMLIQNRRPMLSAPQQPRFAAPNRINPAPNRVNPASKVNTFVTTRRKVTTTVVEESVQIISNTSATNPRRQTLGNSNNINNRQNNNQVSAALNMATKHSQQKSTMYQNGVQMVRSNVKQLSAVQRKVFTSSKMPYDGEIITLD